MNALDKNSDKIKKKRARFAGLSIPAAIGVGFCLIFGILFLPFAILFLIVALAIIASQVLLGEATDDESTTSRPSMTAFWWIAGIGGAIVGLLLLGSWAIWPH